MTKSVINSAIIGINLSLIHICVRKSLDGCPMYVSIIVEASIPYISSSLCVYVPVSYTHLDVYKRQPQSSTQICVVHQIRNSCKYVVYKDKKEFTADMKKDVYKRQVVLDQEKNYVDM